VELQTRTANLFHVRGGKVSRVAIYLDRERAFADLSLVPGDDAAQELVHDHSLSVTSASQPRAIELTLELLDVARKPSRRELRGGYIDLLGEVDPTGPHPGQRWMTSRTLPLIYERIWRPLGGQLLMGATGPGTRGEQRIALAMLALKGDERILDVGCGPGNFTRTFARAAGGGLVVGLDASRTMLERAVRKTDADNVCYVRGDAGALPFSDASFDAVCCFAALYLIEQPMQAVDELVRVLAPTGRLALLSSCSRGPLPAGVTSPLVKALTGVHMFSREEITDALAARGLVGIRQHVRGLAQFVCARKPAR
jgi:SAM-dependent methyltransferase